VAVKAVQVRVTGRVQGVAFRWATQQEASRHGVTGWVRNEPDESVSAHFEGEEAAVDAIVAWCRQGPPSAVVRHVSVLAVPVSGVRRFEVRY